jgi:hypothetical protein
VVLMEFAFDARTEQLRAALVDFMHTRVYPAEPVFAAQLAQSPDQWARDCVPVLAELRAEARRRGLWNATPPACASSAPCMSSAPATTITVLMPNSDHWLTSMNRLQQRIGAAAVQDRGEDPA